MRMICVSRASRPPVIVDGPVASAASTSARLVSDLEPGTRTEARIGSAADGAGQGFALVTCQLSPSSMVALEDAALFWALAAALSAFFCS